MKQTPTEQKRLTFLEYDGVLRKRTGVELTEYKKERREWSKPLDPENDKRVNEQKLDFFKRDLKKLF